MKSVPGMPPLRVLATALRKTTEHLARELTQPSQSAPDWNDLEWTIALSVAAMQGTSALLADTLLWPGPAKWRSLLASQLEQSVLRDERIGSVLEKIAQATREARISCVALKGSAVRALGLYGPGRRPMADLDLLVRSEDLGQMESVLLCLDYVRAAETRRHSVFEPRRKREIHTLGEHANNPLHIEIHTTVSEALPVHTIDITPCLQPENPRSGINAYPSLAALMLHLLLHAASNMRAHALRQIQLHDISALACRFGHADWHELLAQPLGRDRRWWMFPVFSLTDRYYPGSIPPDVLSATHAECHRGLRHSAARQNLTQVSWSNLRIYAFPGLLWSRSPTEAVRFITSRVVPNRIALAELHQNTQAQTQSHLNLVRWYGASHVERVIRWLLLQPPRVQTLSAVTAALEATRSIPG